MKIAYVLPSLAAKAPIFICLELAQYFKNTGHEISIFYFDDIVECETCCKKQRISMNEKIDFSNYDIVHTHMYRPDKFIATQKRFFPNTIFLSTVHCDLFKDLQYSYGSLVACFYSFVWKSYLKKLDGTIQISEPLFEKYNRVFRNNVLIHNGVSIDNAVENEEHRKIFNLINIMRKQGLKIICSFSSVIKRKGIPQIINALKILEDFAYICIGDGEQKEEIEKQVLSLNLNNRVVFCHFLNFPYLILQHADVFVIPSYSEGFSLALLEAGLIGTSAVCSDIPAFNKSFSENEVTFFTLDDIISLVNAIKNAYEKKSIKKKNLQNFVMDQYSQKKMFYEYERFYKTFITN